MDAMWRTLAYQTYPAPSPKVKIIKIKMPHQVAYFEADGKSTDLSLYFARPSELQHLTYTQFNNTYIVKRAKNCRSEPRQPHMDMVLSGRKYYVCQRREQKNITRIEMLYPNAGEIWYLRLILLNRPVKSFADAMTYGGIQHTTFQQSACLHGYVTDEKEALICYDQAAIFSSPAELRFLFVLLTVQGFPTESILYDEER